jgi:hypothetical protein
LRGGNWMVLWFWALHGVWGIIYVGEYDWRLSLHSISSLTTV